MHVQISQMFNKSKLTFQKHNPISIVKEHTKFSQSPTQVNRAKTGIKKPDNKHSHTQYRQTIQKGQREECKKQRANRVIHSKHCTKLGRVSHTVLRQCLTKLNEWLKALLKKTRSVLIGWLAVPASNVKSMRNGKWSVVIWWSHLY